MSFAHGGSYEGVWRADLMHGKGKFELKDGSHYDGQFEAGQVRLSRDTLLVTIESKNASKEFSIN